MRLHITTSDARELDRAMLLLTAGRISYGRWVEVLNAWLANEDVSRIDFGDALPLTERVWCRFRSCEVSTRDVADVFGVPLAHASKALSRLGQKRLAKKASRGRWVVG